nr:methyl-accepting chemotaxis protein [Pseudenhygromyxa sp. WMMC2535]
MIEAFQDKEAYFDLLAAAARSGVEDQVADVEERADGMESIIHFIDDVARRLQLLALNGNIIAAQAGEHGRAFRVVCRELGSLADQAKQTGSEVRKLIQAMGLERTEGNFVSQYDTPEGAGSGSGAGSTSGSSSSSGSGSSSGQGGSSQDSPRPRAD